MIEIEKKFRLREGDEARLIAGAEFIGEKSLTDTYYDTTDFLLTTKDRWLRNRNGKWNLKNPLQEVGRHLHPVDQYEELEEEDEIRGSLELRKVGTLERDLTQFGYAPIGTIITTRRKFQKGDFTIDLDLTDFDYPVAEIELMVTDDAGKEAAVQRVLEFARSAELDMSFVRGKVLEFLFRNRPEHYRALVEAGVVWPDA